MTPESIHHPEPLFRTEPETNDARRLLMQAALPFLAHDRILALLGDAPLPAQGWGAALFADLSGFTALSRRLVEEHGPRRGAERATQALNEILEKLIAPVHGWHGSVLSFSGDGFLCWFGAGNDAALADDRMNAAQSGPHATANIRSAIYCAFSMQSAMNEVRVQGEQTIALKVGMAHGHAHRFLVGDPAVQLLDAIAGSPIAQAVAAESCAQPGEVLLAAETAHALADLVAVSAWRSAPVGGEQIAVSNLRAPLPPMPTPGRVAAIHDVAARRLAPEQVRPWLPEFVWERLAGGQPNFLAELRPAVAIFARFAERQMGEDARAQQHLSDYVAWAQGVFDEAEGAIIQLTLGDKGSYLYGVLGVPIQHDDTALRAAHVARRLARGPGVGDFAPQAQVGMAQGRMRTGAYGSATRRTYGVQGNAVNLGARFMMLAHPGEVLVDPAAATLVEGGYGLTPLPGERLRGFVVPVRSFRLGEPQQQQQYMDRFQTETLIARDEPLAALARGLDAAQAGAFQVIHLIGEAGSGKTALLWQLSRLVNSQVIILNCGAAQTGASYGLVISILRALLGVSPGDGAEADFAALAAALRAHGVEDEAPLAVLAEALGRQLGEEPLSLDIEQRRDVLATLLQHALTAPNDDKAQRFAPHGGAKRDAPVVLLDDFHAADPTSQAVLARLFEAADVPDAHSVWPQERRTGAEGRVEARGALVVTAQRQLSPSISPHGMARVHIMHLSGLTEDESRALLEQRLHGPMDLLATDVLIRYSQGNPLYLTALAEELVSRGDLRQAHLAEENAAASQGFRWRIAEDMFGRLQSAGCLLRRDGYWRLREDAGLGAADLGLPDTLHRLVLAQLDRLPVPTGLTLKAIAVANTSVPEELLVRAHPDVAGGAGRHPGHDRVRADLQMLAARGFVRMMEADGAQRYQVANSVVHDVVYESLLDKQRCDLHLALADGYTEIAPAEIESIAYHCFRCDLASDSLRERALSALEMAVDTARRRYALEAALGFVDCLLSIEPIWQWRRVKFDLLHALGLRPEQAALLAEMSVNRGGPGEYDPTAADPIELALCQARYHEAVSDYDAAEAAIQRALAAARETYDEAAQVESLSLLGQIAGRRGDFAEAERRYQAAMAVLQGDRHATLYGEIAYGLGVAARHQGDFAEAGEQLRAALDFFARRGARRDEALTLTALGGLALMERRYDDGYAYHAQALELRRAINDWPGEGASLVSMAQLRRAQGYHADAVRLLESARRIHRSLRNRWWEIRIMNEIGVIYLVAGMFLEARTTFEEAIELAQTIGDHGGEIIPLLNLGQALRDLGEIERAREALNNSLAKAQAQGEKYAETQCYSDLARTFLISGEYEQAVVTADKALELLKELGLDAAVSADLATQAEAHLALAQAREAATAAEQIVALLDRSDGDGADFPQRDYWVAYTVLKATGHDTAAAHALAQSQRHLRAMADRFQDPEMRAAFLENLPVNRAIAQVSAMTGWQDDGMTR